MKEFKKKDYFFIIFSIFVVIGAVVVCIFYPCLLSGVSLVVGIYAIIQATVSYIINVKSQTELLSEMENNILNGNEKSIKEIVQYAENKEDIKLSIAKHIHMYIPQLTKNKNYQLCLEEYIRIYSKEAKDFIDAMKCVGLVDENNKLTEEGKDFFENDL